MTELTTAAVVDYLLERGIVEPRSVVEGDLEIRDASSRNRNFVVASRDGTSVFVKHAPGPSERETLAREAAILGQLQGTPVRHHVPRVVDFSADRSVLVLALVAGARNPRYQRARGRFSRELGARTGRALGELHACTRGAVAAGAGGPPPWPLAVHRPQLSWLRDLSEAALALIRAIQRVPDLGRQLDEVRAGWRTECLVHGDFKWDNCLVVPGRDGRVTALRLCDWELAGAGDPAWDVGAAFAAYVAAWLHSIPITGEDPPERFAQLARLPLERMRPALRALWRAYASSARLEAGAVDRELVLAVRLGAGRLLQSAFEQAQMTDRLPGTAYCVLQVALNMLRRPHEAAVRLLGIPLAGEQPS